MSDFNKPSFTDSADITKLSANWTTLEGKLATINSSITTTNTNVSTNASHIGTMDDLYTTTKTSLVGAANEICVAVDGLGEKLNEDYIVDKGTEGDWNFVKWNSGLYEAYMSNKEFTDVAMTTAWGSLFYGKIEGIALPTTMESNAYFVSAIKTSGQACWFAVIDKTKTSFGLTCYRPESTTGSVKIDVYIRGVCQEEEE